MKKESEIDDEEQIKQGPIKIINSNSSLGSVTRDLSL